MAAHFTLNGIPKQFSGDPDYSLLTYLREEENITSVKDGCSQGAVCGCCTVAIDGKAVKSCTMPMRKVAGKTILTVEGLSPAMQDIFATSFACKGGTQCGFCTPGFVMKAHTFLQKNPHPTADEVAQALSTNLCRCTGYKKIIESILTVADLQTSAEKLLTQQNAVKVNSGKIGHRLSKYDARALTLGQQKFVADIKLPGMCYGALKFSDFPRARVEKITIDAAAKLPGVIAILTAKDIPGARFQGLIAKDWPLMVEVGEETRYVGDVLATVIANTLVDAQKALAKIEIIYSERPPITTTSEAAAENAAKIHPGGNKLGTSAFTRGDPHQYFQEPANSNTDIIIAEGTFSTQRIEHAFLETESAIAKPIQVNGQDGIYVYSQGQGVYEDRKQLASLLNMNESQIQVEQVPTGGGFGGKEDLTVQGHAALMAKIVNRPVLVSLNRKESMRMHPKRHPFEMDYKVACNTKGELLALDAKIIADTGAYASVGMKVVERGVGHATGAYNIPNVAVQGTAYYTNNSPCGAMRGFGVNQVVFAIESCLDELCEKGGFDRWQFRYDNAIKDGDQTATGQIIRGGAGVRQTLEAVKDAFYQAKYAGIACGIKNTGIGNGMPDSSEVKLTIDALDQITIHHGWTEMGQGVHTVAIQTVCQELGFDPNIFQVKVNTNADTPCGMTTASRATSLVGNALINACQELKRALDKSPLSELVGQSFRGKWVCDWTAPPGSGPDQATHYSYSYATQVVTLTDEGKIEKIIAAHDAGKIVNPMLFEGQIEGSVHMGLGYAISEDYPLEKGFPLHDTLLQCGILKAKETPPITVIGIEVNDPVGPYGAKGVGEIGLVPTAAAVVNALYQFDKKRRYRLPLNEKNILRR